MSIGTLLVIPLVVIDFAFEMLREAHALWNWQYKAEIQQFFNSFSERHRLSLRSLGQKPLP